MTKLRAIYARVAPQFLRSKNFPEDLINVCDFEADMEVTTLLVNTGSSKMGIHRDPGTPMPALLCGTTTYALSSDGASWQPAMAGGQFFIADGMFAIPYRPTDVLCAALPSMLHHPPHCRLHVHD